MGFFKQVSLETPESVELEFKLAGIGNRAYALLIDYLVLGIVLIVILITWTILLFQLLKIFEGFENFSEKFYLWLIAIQVLIIFTIYVGYFVFFEVVGQGQTPGKRRAKIRVIGDDGRQIKLQQSTLRALLRPVDDMFFLGVFLIVFTKKEKRLGDWLAGTIVVQEEAMINSATEALSLSSEAESLANFLVKEAQISRLIPEDFALIKRYLERRNEMLPQAKIEVSSRLAQRLKEIIALDKIPTEIKASVSITASVFVEAVYLAYQKSIIKS